MQNLSLRFLNTMGQYSLNLKRLGRFSLIGGEQQNEAQRQFSEDEEEDQLLASFLLCLQATFQYIIIQYKLTFTAGHQLIFQIHSFTEDLNSFPGETVSIHVFTIAAESGFAYNIKVSVQTSHFDGGFCRTLYAKIIIHIFPLNN